MANRLLYLARHGESAPAQAGNPEDGDLTEIGRQQSELLGKRLQGIPFAAIHRELLISHGNLINWFVAQALDAPDQAWLRMLDYSCALTVIMYFPDRTRLVSYNDMGHLPPALRGTD